MESPNVVLVFFSVLINYCRLTIGWGCVDDTKTPVDWLIIYKPPIDVDRSIIKESEYVYISSANPETQWMVGDLEKANALYDTLAPLKSVRHAEVAAVVYDRRPHNKASDGTAAMGVLLANQTGGLWLMHTVPNFPNLVFETLELPQAQYHVGQMFVCISFKLPEMNQIALVLQAMMPRIVYVKIPRGMSAYLPDWVNINVPDETGEPFIMRYDLKTSLETPLTLIYRTPNTQQCMYRTFAESFNVILDVYAKITPLTRPSICTENFGVRQIQNISTKILLEDIYYIDRKMDNARFAITAAAHWQELGQQSSFWTCFSNVDNDDSSNGAALVCIEDYAIWNSMFMLKNAEPLCPAKRLINKMRSSQSVNSIDRLWKPTLTV